MPIDGVMYWGVESHFHTICIEADQSFKRQWSEVIEYIDANPEEAAKLGVVQEGDINLTPLAIVSSEGPPDVVKAVLKASPGAVTIPDRYGELPIHRAALQHRQDGAEEVVRALRDADPTTLLTKDRYRMTPLICAVGSSRGLTSLEMVRILLSREDPFSVANATDKKGRKALDIVRARTSKIKNEKMKQDIVELLEKYDRKARDVPSERPLTTTKPLAPIAPLFALLNWVAFVGWAFVLCRVILPCLSSGDFWCDSLIIADVETTVIGLEIICGIEVCRILLGDLPGNLVLGVILHAIRLTAITQVLPRAPLGHWTGPAILVSWAVTECSRYPMYMFPKNEAFRSIRMVVPLVTFPIGAFSEAFGVYVVFRDPATPGWLRIILAAVLFVNGVLGPTMAYPALLRKGLPVLGLAKKREKRPAKKME